MYAPHQNIHDRGDLMHIPAIRVAVVLSLLLHLLLLVTWRHKITAEPPSPEHAGKGAIAGSLRAHLAPPPAARPSPPASPPAPSRPAEAARAAPPPRKPPPKPAPEASRPLLSGPEGPRLAQPSPLPPSPPRAPEAEPDMAALVEARRRAREANRSPAVPPAAPPVALPAEPPDDAAARSERSIAANLGSLRAPSPGENPRRGGGVFQIRRVGAEDAEFLFFGWNPDMRRNNTQLVEVRRGSNPNMRLAIVRRMIEIIRTHENGDFVWESRRLNRNITLSARAADNADLEAFLFAEFF